MANSEKLKVGDEITIRGIGLGGSARIEKIDSITPSGRIRLRTIELNPDLTVRGEGRWGYSRLSVNVTTDEDREEIEHNRLWKILDRNTCWKELPLECLRAIVEMLDNRKKESHDPRD